MDIQSFLRLKNLFPQPMAQPGLDTYSNSADTMMPPLSGLDNTPAPDTNSNLLEAFQPRHTISDQYTSALSSMPQRPQPGALRNVAAAIAGMGAGASAQGISGGQPIGFKYDPRMADIASDKVKYGDYDNQLADWQNQVKALGLGANEEDRANLGEAKRLAGNADRDIKQQGMDIKQQAIDVAWQKENDIFETKKRQDSDKVNHWNAQEKNAADALKLKPTPENQQKLAEARIKAQNARTEAQATIAEQKLAEAKMQHEKVMAELEMRRQAMSKQTDTTVNYDANGNIVGKRITSQPMGGQVITDPETGHRYDTTTWSAADIAAAKAKGWR